MVCGWFHLHFFWLHLYGGAVGLKSVRIHKTHRIHVWCMGTDGSSKKCDPAAIVCCFTPFGGSTHVFQKKTSVFSSLAFFRATFSTGFCNGFSHGGEYVGGGFSKRGRL